MIGTWIGDFLPWFVSHPYKYLTFYFTFLTFRQKKLMFYHFMCCRLSNYFSDLNTFFVINDLRNSRQFFPQLLYRFQLLRFYQEVFLSYKFQKLKSITSPYGSLTGRRKILLTWVQIYRCCVIWYTQNLKYMEKVQWQDFLTNALWLFLGVSQLSGRQSQRPYFANSQLKKDRYFTGTFFFCGYLEQ